MSLFKRCHFVGYIAALVGFVANCASPPKGNEPVTAATQARPVAAQLFPTMTAQTLAKRSVVFPDETKGKVGLLFVAFEQDAQQQINSWLEPVLSRYLTSQEVSYYEIPMISGAYGVVSSFIDGGMRRGVPAALHDRTATYYGPRQAFFEALGITDTSRPYLFVLNRQGQIVFRTSGWYNGIDAQAAIDAVTAALGDGRPKT